MSDDKKVERKITMSLVASCKTSLGEIRMMADLEAERVVQYLYFDDILVPAKGKAPARIFTSTVSEWEKFSAPFLAGFEAAQCLMLADLSKEFKILTGSCLIEDPTDKEKMIKDGSVLIESAKILNKFIAANKPVNGPSVRKVGEYLDSIMANAYLIAAGVSGKIPEMEEMVAMMAEHYKSGRTAAQKKAKELGLDGLGQFRLKKEKTDKKDEKKDEPSDSDVTSEEDSAPETTN